MLLAAPLVLVTVPARSAPLPGRIDIQAQGGHISAWGDGTVCAYGGHPEAQFSSCGPGKVTIVGFRSATVVATIRDQYGVYKINVEARGKGPTDIGSEPVWSPPHSVCYTGPQYQFSAGAEVRAERSATAMGSFTFKAAGTVNLGPVTSANFDYGTAAILSPVVGICLL